MWNNQQPGYGSAPPAFPGFPSPNPASAGGAPGFPQAGGAPGGFPQPGGASSGFPEAPGGYNHVYASYGPPQGAPPSGYGPPQGPPPSGYHPPPPGGPPHGYGPPQGPPPSGYHAPPPGPPPQQRGYPGQQYHHQQQNSGYPGQNAHSQYHPPAGPPPPMPPTQVQNYGPHFQGSHNTDAQPFFQYSQCNGKKKALCIGINYFGTSAELKGCINDANNIKNFLCSHFGYKEEDIVMLTDDAKNSRMLPTRANIEQAMSWLVRDAHVNDSLFFHYSGHGGQTKDLDGDEGDGYDEVIYPMDFETNGHIVDDEMHNIMVKPLPAGCRLTAIFDSCHSGSALDLPYIYSTEGKIKEPNLAMEAGQGLLSAVTSYARGDIGGVFKSAMGIVKTATGNTSKADKLSKATRTSPADCISWSGCKDSQTSADTQEAGTATGAMSFAFISALKTNPQQSYQQLLNSIRDILRSKYSQKPQLSSSHPMDTSIMFIC